MAKNVEGFPAHQIENYELSPCRFIFDHVTKPKDYLYCRSINVYDDRWRVNIYSKRIVDEIEGKYISQSYFIHFNKNNGDIAFVSPHDIRSPQC